MKLNITEIGKYCLIASAFLGALGAAFAKGEVGTTEPPKAEESEAETPSVQPQRRY